MNQMRTQTGKPAAPDTARFRSHHNRPTLSKCPFTNCTSLLTSPPPWGAVPLRLLASASRGPRSRPVEPARRAPALPSPLQHAYRRGPPSAAGVRPGSEAPPSLAHATPARRPSAATTPRRGATAWLIARPAARARCSKPRSHHPATWTQRAAGPPQSSLARPRPTAPAFWDASAAASIPVRPHAACCQPPHREPERPPIQSQPSELVPPRRSGALSAEAGSCGAARWRSCLPPGEAPTPS